MDKICTKFTKTSVTLSCLFLVLTNTLHVYATPSTWSQTSWVGGSGQDAWSDITKYSTSTSIDYSSQSGQISLSPNPSYISHWGDGWKYRKKLTLNNADQAENLTNFPILVKLTSSNFDFSKAQASGQDIRFIDADDSTELPYEIESWSSVGQEANIWVKVPQVDASSSTDFIYMYYGNPTAADAQNKTSVWDSNFKMVQHLAETSGQHLDSTSNGYDSTSITLSSQGGVGYINGGDTFIAGNGDDVTFGTFPKLYNNFTVNVWVKPTAYPGNYSYLVNMGRDSAVSGWSIMLLSNGTVGYWYRDTGSQWMNGTRVVDLNQWNMITIKFDNSGMKTYINGTPDVSRGYISDISYLNNEVLKMGEMSYWWNLFNSSAIIDELEISSVSRSDPWIAAQYSSMNDTFVSYGSETVFAWWSSTWKYRQKITFDNSNQAENLTNFPVLVKLNSSRIDYSLTKDNGEDIRFTDSDGVTSLPYEIESWNEIGDSFVWVKVPQVDASSSTDHIYIYFGNPGAIDSQNKTAVWDSNFKMVQHLAETSGNHIDSTSNANNATTTNVTSQGLAEAKIGGADDFNGSSNWVNFPRSTTFDPNAFTISFFAKPDSVSGNQLIFIMGENGSDGFGPQNELFCMRAGAYVECGVSDESDFVVWASVTIDTYHWFTLTFDGSTAILYKNGSVARTDPVSNPINTTNWTNYFSWGDKFSGGISRYYDGKIDEIQVSNTVRSPSWISAQYSSMNDTFSTYGEKENHYSTSSSLTSSIFDTTQSSNFGNITWTVSGTGTTTVKVRTSQSSTMSGATSFTSCDSVTNSTDLSTNNCVTDGDRYIQYQVNLTSDGYTSPDLESISIDYDLNTNPNGEITINSGNSTSPTRSVTLSLSSSDDMTSSTNLQMLLSNSSDLSSSSWEPFVSSKSWSLPSGDGTKSVYVKYKDEAGNESSTHSDTIILDTATPSSDWGVDSEGRDCTVGSSDCETKTFSLNAVSDSSISQVSSDNLYTEDTLPTFVFTKAKDSTSGIDKYQVLIMQSVHNSQASDGSNIGNSNWNSTHTNNTSYEVYIDNILHDSPGSSSAESDKTRDSDEKYTYYKDKHTITVRSKRDTDKLLPGAYKFKVRAIDKTGHSTDTGEKTLRISTNTAIFSRNGSGTGGATVFPLTLLQVGDKSNLNISSLDPDSTKKYQTSTGALSTSTFTPTFYGISNVGAHVYLVITSGQNNQTTTQIESIHIRKETTVNSESRYGINIEETDNLKPGIYQVSLIARNDDNDYVELPTFTLKVGSSSQQSVVSSQTEDSEQVTDISDQYTGKDKSKQTQKTTNTTKTNRTDVNAQNTPSTSSSMSDKNLGTSLSRSNRENSALGSPSPSPHFFCIPFTSWCL